VVNTGTVIEDNVILNTGCTVDHHNYIGSHAHLAPGAHLGGDVRIGEGALVGIGTTVIPGRRIGDWAVVGAGSVVTRDIPPYTTAVGIPARVIKRHEPEG
jgi:acetyltransferase-like isoleucine patch superfamily enzyme